jgi:hypothetical protein
LDRLQVKRNHTSDGNREFAIPSFNIINTHEKYDLYVIFVLVLVNL